VSFQPPPIWMETPGMVWHRALTTFPDAAHTLCGRYKRAFRFQAGRPTFDSTGELRPKVCHECREGETP
jgi:hypothetical protein